MGAARDLHLAAVECPSATAAASAPAGAPSLAAVGVSRARVWPSSSPSPPIRFLQGDSDVTVTCDTCSCPNGTKPDQVSPGEKDGVLPVGRPAPCLLSEPKSGWPSRHVSASLWATLLLTSVVTPLATWLISRGVHSQTGCYGACGARTASHHILSCRAQTELVYCREGRGLPWPRPGHRRGAWQPLGAERLLQPLHMGAPSSLSLALARQH